VSGSAIRALRLFQSAPNASDGVSFDTLVFTFADAPVPAPATLGLFGMGLATLGLRRRCG